MRYYYVAYGSLMDHRALTESIPDRHFTPVVIKGWRRIFDVRDVRSKEPDVLNAEKLRGHDFNAVLFQVSHSELRKLMKRETEYKLTRVKAHEFLTGKMLCGCFMVTDRGVGIDTTGLKPNRSYFIECRRAAYHVSNEFGRYYDETTFISDGEKLSNWVKRNRSYATLREG
jgi:cation transport regulator ChaC